MGHCKMTRQLRMSVSQKLASWKGSAEDAKAGKYKIRVNPRNLRLISLRAFCAFSWLKNPCNQRNPRLTIYSSYLRGEKIREISVNPRLISLRAFCAFLWLKNPFNLRNPRLMNYLRTFGIFTTVESALQIHLFMQNEPNFRKSQMNVNKVLTKDYDKRTLGEYGKNEPKTNPNEPNFNGQL